VWSTESDLSATHSVMTEHLIISDETFYDVKKRYNIVTCISDMIPTVHSIRKYYLEHLESWKVSLVSKVKTELCSKVSNGTYM